jgi:hypothetical protein
VTLFLAASTIVVGGGWLLAVRRHDHEAVTPLPTRSQLAVEGLLFAVTLGLAILTVATMIGDRT